VYDIRLEKVNEAFIQVHSERNIAQELSDYFTFYVPGYQFTPAFKARYWDGKIRLLDLRTMAIYHGLVPYIEKFCKERDYKIEIDSEITVTDNYSLKEADDFIKTLGLPFEPRDYQTNSFVHAIRNKRILLLSPTASGKSLIIYLILRYIQQTQRKGLLIVPTTSLVEQMYTDFESYGYNSEQYCHRQYAGKDNVTDKFLTITTWQSIYKLNTQWFEPYGMVIGDEAHLFKAKSLASIMEKLNECKYRFGFTGTLDGTQTHKLVLEGLFGAVKKVTTTAKLIEDNHLSAFKIKCLVLKHSDAEKKLMARKTYQEEMDYLVRHDGRNKFISKLTLSLEGNTLVLFQYVDKHGKDLYKQIKDKAHDKRHVFFVHGGVDGEDREAIRQIVEKEKDAIIIASYGTFSTGVNIRNLHNIVFSSPTKSMIRTLQSIGRGLRLGDDKEEAVLYDISDDLRTKSWTNHTMNHFAERIKIYTDEQFQYKIYPIEI
jgi:superfamily II DNA or RNA helicase